MKDKLKTHKKKKEWKMTLVKVLGLMVMASCVLRRGLPIVKHPAHIEKHLIFEVIL